MRTRIVSLILAALVTAIVPLSVAAQTEGSQPDSAIAVDSDATQDAAIAVRIREILGQLDRYGAVSVTVADGIVSLRGSVLDPAHIEELSGLVSRIEGVVAIENQVIESTDLRERLAPALARINARTEQFIAFLPLIAVALLAGVTVTWLGFLLARRRWPWDVIAPNAFIADIYRQVLRLVFVVAGLVLTLDLLNATALLGTILGAAGIVGLAIGFAVRDTVENFISSIMLSVRQPFRPKDLVEIEGELGHVIRLTSRATILLSLDGNHVRLPNATVFKSKIINYTRNDERRFTFLLGIDPVADIAEAQAVILAALGELPFVLDSPAPAVWVDGLGASTIDVMAAAWIMQHQTSIGMAKGEAIRVVKARLEEAGIGLPEPTYRLIGAATAAASDAVPTIETVLSSATFTDDETYRVEVQSVGAEETDALTSLIEAERESLPDDDLLRGDGLQE